jgi:hypothetical protein
MTFEQLFVAIDTEASAHKLRPSAIRLLLHLIATSINDGTQQVRTSRRYLSTLLAMSPKTINRATRRLASLISVETPDGVTTTYTIPSQWFTAQPGLFARQAEISTIHNCGRNSHGAVAQKNTPDLDGVAGNPTPLWHKRAQPGRSVGENPTPRPISVGENPTPRPISVGENPTPQTENQRLATSSTNVFDSIESGFSSKELSVQVIDRIARATTVAEENKNDARVLSEHLRAYIRAFGGPHHDKGNPDQLVLARCFAIAPLGDLENLLLNDMRRFTPPAFDSYMYIVSIFAEKIHGIKNLTAKLKALQPALTPQQRQLQFKNEIINYTMARAKRMA